MNGSCKKREGKELQNQPQKESSLLCVTQRRKKNSCKGKKKREARVERVINVLFMFQLRLSLKDRNRKMNIHGSFKELVTPIRPRPLTTLCD